METPTPAGLLDSNFEFFEKENEVYFLQNGSLHKFDEIDVKCLDFLRADLEDHPKAIAAMEQTGIFDPVAQLKQWALCNFGNFDNKADLTEDGVVIREHVRCAKRGTCPFEGIICQPLVVANGTITSREEQIIKLIARDLADKQIAAMLGISVNTMAVHRQNIERKIGCQSKMGIVAFAYENNLL